MPPTTAASQISCVSAPLPALDADLLLVPWFQDDMPIAVPGLDAATGGDIGRAVASGEFGGKLFETFAPHTSDGSWRPRRLLLIGAGRSAEYSPEVARQVAAAAGLAARSRRASKAAFVLRGTGDSTALAQAVAEGLTLSEFNVGTYKTGEPAPARPPMWTVATTEESRGLAAR